MNAEEPEVVWITVEKPRRALDDPGVESPGERLRFRYTENAQLVEKHLSDFQAGQDNIDENPERFSPYQLPESERETFDKSDKAKRLFEILIGDDSKYNERQKALNWLLTYNYQPAVDWFHKQFQKNPKKYMGYRPVPTDYKFHKLLSANEDSQAAIENEIRKMVAAKGHGWKYTELMQKIAPERFLDFCQTEMERTPRRYYANILANSRPSLELVEAIRLALQQVPDDGWSGPIAILLENESTRHATLELVDQCQPKEPTLGWWRTLGLYGTEAQRETAIQEIEKFELDKSKCEVLYDIDHEAGLAEFDKYLETLDSKRRRTFQQMTYYPYECYYGMKIEDGQLEFIKWVIRVGLGSYPMEALCEAWRGSEGDTKAAADLGPTLLETLRDPSRKFPLTAVDALGQLYRATGDQEVVTAIVESERIHFADDPPDNNALERYARNLQLIGGKLALDLAHSFWSRIDPAELLESSFARWFDQQWCQHGLTIDSLLDELKDRGHQIKSDAETLYMEAWDEFNDRRQSAPTLAVHPQGFYESVVVALDSTHFGAFTYHEFEYVVDSLQKLSENKFNLEAIQTSPEQTTFVYNKRLVHFEPANTNYGVAKFIDLANELMTLDRNQDASSKRFILLPASEDYRYCVLYDEPEQLKSLTSKFFLLHPQDRQP